MITRLRWLLIFILFYLRHKITPLLFRHYAADERHIAIVFIAFSRFSLLLTYTRHTPFSATLRCCRPLRFIVFLPTLSLPPCRYITLSVASIITPLRHFQQSFADMLFIFIIELQALLRYYRWLRHASFMLSYFLH